VGVNPGATDFEHEMRRFYWKVEAGAEYAITQPVFDSAQLFRFLDHIEKEGLRIPIIAGIWPLVSARNAEFLANEVPGVVVPEAVIERMRRASAIGKDEGVEEGIRIAQQMLSEAHPRIQGVQVSAPFGKVPLALRVFDVLPGWAEKKLEAATV
jgi:methionine synthase / methylenetetrahydrofolate reductase(NADPH)